MPAIMSPPFAFLVIVIRLLIDDGRVIVAEENLRATDVVITSARTSPDNDTTNSARAAKNESASMPALAALKSFRFVREKPMSPVKNTPRRASLLLTPVSHKPRRWSARAAERRVACGPNLSAAARPA